MIAGLRGGALARIPHVVESGSLPAFHRSVFCHLSALVVSGQDSQGSRTSSPCVASASLTSKARRALSSRRSNDSADVYVASAVCGLQSGSSNANAPDVVSVGVNFALHRATQLLSKSCGCTGGAAPLHGLLKGCAEQNALGSFAAAGNSYHRVRHVFLCSTPTATTIRNPNTSSMDSGDCELLVRMPCAECWAHLCAVAAMVHQCTQGVEKLHLHVATIRPSVVGSAQPSFWWDPSLVASSHASGSNCPDISFVSIVGPSECRGVPSTLHKALECSPITVH